MEPKGAMVFIGFASLFQFVFQLYPGDRAHRMPIITPAYPAMCATHNVTASTQMVMTEEFKKGADIVDKVIVGTAEWSELFAKHEFFHKYRYYLQVIASTGSAALQIKWYAYILPHSNYSSQCSSFR